MKSVYLKINFITMVEDWLDRSSLILEVPDNVSTEYIKEEIEKLNVFLNIDAFDTDESAYAQCGFNIDTLSKYLSKLHGDWNVSVPEQDMESIEIDLC